MRKFISLFAVALSGCAAANTPGAKNPLLASSGAFYAQVKEDVLRSAEKMPEENFSFKPAPDVRTFGELLAHVADAQFLLCSIVSGGKPTMKSNEKTAKNKAEIVTALKDGFAFCDAQYAKLSDQDAAAIVSWFGRKRTKLSVLDFNTAHAFEHYGNMVTYMRMKGIVPPSSEKRGQ